MLNQKAVYRLQSWIIIGLFADSLSFVLITVTYFPVLLVSSSVKDLISNSRRPIRLELSPSCPTQTPIPGQLQIYHQLYHCLLLFQWKIKANPLNSHSRFYTSLLVTLFHISSSTWTSTIATTSTCSKYLSPSSWNKQINSFNFVLPSLSNHVSFPPNQISRFIAQSLIPTSLYNLTIVLFPLPLALQMPDPRDTFHSWQKEHCNPLVTETLSFPVSHPSTGSLSQLLHPHILAWDLSSSAP